MVSMGNGIFIPNKMAISGTMVSSAMQPMLAGMLQSGLVAPQSMMAGITQPGLTAQPAIGFSPNATMSQMFLMANNFSLAGSMLMQFSGMLQMLMQGLASGAQPQPQPLPQPLPQPPVGFPTFPLGNGGNSGSPDPSANLLKSIMSLLPNLMALAGPQVPPPNYNGGTNSRYWGDPHLVGFDGEKYDVMGKGGNIYNMLSDKDVQYNTKFVDWGNPGKDGVQPTVIGEAGIQVGKHLVYFDRSGKAPTVNGKPLFKNEKIDLGSGKFAQWDGQKLVVKTDEYIIDLQVKQPDKNGGYIDSNVAINDGINPLADGVNPHGLLGQTADGVKGARKGGDGNQNIKKQGGDVIDGVVDDYKTDTLWDNTFKYNRFQAEKENDDLSALLAVIQGLARDLAA